MAIRMVKMRVISGQDFKYVTDDGEEFVELEAAVEHENKINALKPKPVIKYEFVTSIQQAINMAVAEHRVVRFLWPHDNKKIKASIEDIKGCKLLKPDKNSHDVAIVPEGCGPFDFDEVK